MARFYIVHDENGVHRFATKDAALAYLEENEGNGNVSIGNDDGRSYEADYYSEMEYVRFNWF